MKEIRLTRGYVALVDDDDYEYLNQFKWHALVRSQTLIYAYSSKMGLMHRNIINTPGGLLTDHIDHNGLNNQKHNLRTCTRSENQKNKRGHGTSRYLGVYLQTVREVYYKKKTGEYVTYENSQWSAQITHNHKQINLGLFKIEEDAARAYDEAAKIYHGEFANLNFK